MRRLIFILALLGAVSVARASTNAPAYSPVVTQSNSLFAATTGGPVRIGSCPTNAVTATKIFVDLAGVTNTVTITDGAITGWTP